MTFYNTAKSSLDIERSIAEHALQDGIGFKTLQEARDSRDGGKQPIFVVTVIVEQIEPQL